MGIETLNLRTEHNPAWMAVEYLKSYLVSEFGLHPNTVKSFLSPEQIIPATALASIAPRTEIHWEKLTPWEKSLLQSSPSEIAKISRIAIVDIDGVYNDIFSPTDWTNSSDLAALSQRVERMIITSHRIPINENGPVWQLLTKLIPNSQRLSFSFPILTVQRAIEIEEKLTWGKTKVIHGSKWFNTPASREILSEIDHFGQSAEDPYLVYVGSGLPDIFLFARIINHLKKTERPFDRIVLCLNGHLIQ